MFSFDNRRNFHLCHTRESAEEFAFQHWVETANLAIQQRQAFFVALSGGSTPAAIFQRLASATHLVDWSKVFLFWSDERTVPLDHPDSNYRMAMEAGLSKLPIPFSHIFPMQSKQPLNQRAEDYAAVIKHLVPNQTFDLIMLGMGEDGHTASLFPYTEALKEEEQDVAANYIPNKQTWRITMTFPCIQRARQSAVYVLGDSKAEMVEKVFTDPYQPEKYPIQKVGTTLHKALWILDSAASSKLKVPEGICLS